MGQKEFVGQREDLPDSECWTLLRIALDSTSIEQLG